MLKNYSSFLKTTFLSAVILLTGALMISCGDDDGGGPSVDPLVGQYILSGATALSDASSPVSDVEISEGQDLLVPVSVALLAASPCDPANDVTYVQLEEDSTFDLVCRDSDESADGGRWSINEERTSLQLDLLIQGQTFSVVMNDFEDDGTTISGDINNLPLPLALFDPSIGNFDQLILVNTELVFTRVQ